MSQILRRQFLVASGALLAASLVKARAPAGRFRIGMLLVGDREDADFGFIQPVLAGLRDLGYVSGENLIADIRTGNSENLETLADELIALKPNLLLGTEITGGVMKAKTSTIPIVLLISADPVALKLVHSLARPGTNVTGMAGLLYTLVNKQVELLTEVVTKMSRVALLTSTFNPSKDSPLLGTPDSWKLSAEQAAKSKGLTLVLLRADDPDGLRWAFAALKDQRAEGLVVATNANVTRMHSQIMDEIQKRRIPAISGYRKFALSGGLLSYGPNFVDTSRYAAKFVDRILGGARPAELPVEQVSKYDLLVNRKTARELGLAIPPSIIVWANQVIE